MLVPAAGDPQDAVVLCLHRVRAGAHDCDYATEFSVGECEAHRGRYEQKCRRQRE